MNFVKLTLAAYKRTVYVRSDIIHSVAEHPKKVSDKKSDYGKPFTLVGLDYPQTLQKEPLTVIESPEEILRQINNAEDALPPPALLQKQQ